MMSVNELVSWKRRSPFVLITDNAEENGELLLAALIQGCVDHKHEVHICCFSHHVPSFAEFLRLPKDANVKYHDFFTDHRGWLGQRCNEYNFVHDLDKVFSSTGENAIVIFDCVASMILNSSISDVYKMIHRYLGSSKKKGGHICGLLHRDMVEDCELAEMCHLANTVLRVQPPRVNSHGRPLCFMHHRTTKGKILSGVEHFSVDSCNKLWSEEYKANTPIAPMEHVDPMVDVTTFKLSLEEKEKEARRQLVLPYLKDDSAKDSVGSGVIHYQPDEMDDWDEEDPDNDLNI